MFERLTDKFGAVFRKLKGQAILDEKNIQEGLREVRLALLEADVNFKVVKIFLDRVTERCLGQDVDKSLKPTQQVIKAVHEELIELLGGQSAELDLRGRAPAVIMVVGLQGSGKTTSSAKLANYLRQKKMKPYLASLDVYRPAAIEQLAVLAAELGISAYPASVGQKPADIAAAAVEEARKQSASVVILDTAGRLHIDEAMMLELSAVKDRIKPHEILLVADAMTGQDAVNVAESFNRELALSGVILSKMEGDARGGAALSIKSVTGCPIKFVGTGEKLTDIEAFHPDRIAGRILGMGDMLTLIEKSQSGVSEEELTAMHDKFRKAEFNLEDFRTHMRRLKRLGSLEGIKKLIPGMGELRRRLGEVSISDKELNRLEAIINSMTRQERNDPKIIDKSRKRRISSGSGTTVQDVSSLLMSFETMKRMMKQSLDSGKMPRLGMPGMPGMGGMPALPKSGGGTKALKKKVKRKKRK